MKYYFIATNYNNSHHTVNYINNICSLETPKNCSKHIIIVDNQSEEPLTTIEETIENVQKKGFDAKLIVNTSNSGYFKGLNVGIDNVSKTNEFMTIVGNNDLIFNQDFLLKLHDVKLEKADYCIAPNVYLPNGRKQNPHVFVKPGKKEIKLLELYYKNYYFGRLMVKVNGWLKKQKAQIDISKPTYIHGGIGAIYILTQKFFEKNKRLNAPVFLYGEEVILSNQIHATGGKLLYHPDIKVMHNEHSSVSKLGSKKLHKIGKESFKIFKDYY